MSEMKHHALLFVGTFEDALGLLPSEIHVPSTDVRHVLVSAFGVDDARMLSEEASRTPLAGKTRSFVVSLRTATIEAQNALLKTLEEPAKTSRFYFIVPHEDALLSTVRSRLMRMDMPEASGDTAEAVMKDFLKKNLGERIAEIGVRAKAKDEMWMSMLFEGIEKFAEKKKEPELIRDVVFVRSHYSARGASKKMLLEHLVLALPSGV